jgi:hypothetical protein
MPSKDIERLVRELRRQGFTVELGKRSGHYKVRRDGKTLTSLPCTPGGGGHVFKQIVRRAKKRLIAAGYEGELTW